MLTFHATTNQRQGKKIHERTITATGLEKTFFLENTFDRKSLELSSNGITDTQLMTAECFLIWKRIILPLKFPFRYTHVLAHWSKVVVSNRYTIWTDAAKNARPFSPPVILNTSLTKIENEMDCVYLLFNGI